MTDKKTSQKDKQPNSEKSTKKPGKGLALFAILLALIALGGQWFYVVSNAGYKSKI